MTTTLNVWRASIRQAACRAADAWFAKAVRNPSTVWLAYWRAPVGGEPVGGLTVREAGDVPSNRWKPLAADVDGSLTRDQVAARLIDAAWKQPGFLAAGD